MGSLGGESLPAGVDVPPRRDDGRKLVAVDMNDGNGLLVCCSGSAKVASPIMDEELHHDYSVLCCTTGGQCTYSQDEVLPIIPRPVFPPIPSTSGVNNPPLLPTPACAWWSLSTPDAGSIGDFWRWTFGDKGGLNDREACLERERPAPGGKRDSIGGGAPCECFVSYWVG